MRVALVGLLLSVAACGGGTEPKPPEIQYTLADLAGAWRSEPPAFLTPAIDRFVFEAPDAGDTMLTGRYYDLRFDDDALEWYAVDSSEVFGTVRVGREVIFRWPPRTSTEPPVQAFQSEFVTPTRLESAWFYGGLWDGYITLRKE